MFMKTWNYIREEVNTAAKLFVPRFRRNKVRGKKAPWWSELLKKEGKRKHKTWKEYIKMGGEEEHKTYMIQRNQTTKVIRDARMY